MQGTKGVCFGQNLSFQKYLELATLPCELINTDEKTFLEMYFILSIFRRSWNKNLT